MGFFSGFSLCLLIFYFSVFFLSQSRRRCLAGIRACRIVCAWVISPLYAMEPPSPSSGLMDLPSRTSSSQHATGTHLAFCPFPYKSVNTRLVCVLGSKSESVLSGKTLRSRGSCWGRGNLPPWHLRPVWSRTNERAGAMAKRMKRKITTAAQLLLSYITH